MRRRSCSANAPNRQLHNLVLAREHADPYRLIASSAHDPDILRVAAWYHGAFLTSGPLRSLPRRLSGELPAAPAEIYTRGASPHQPLASLTRSWRVDEPDVFVTRHRARGWILDAQVPGGCRPGGLSCSPQESKKIHCAVQELVEPTTLDYHARIALA